MVRVAIDLIDDKEILKQFSDGNRELAATGFVRKYQSFVFSIALRYVQNYDDADDIAQDVFIKVIQSIDTYRGDSSLKTWLYRITVNHSISYIRKQKIKGFFGLKSKDTIDELELIDRQPHPDKLLEHKELNEKFINSLAKLPEKQRETFALRYFDDLTYEQISNMLNVSVGGLKANYFHAVQKLARMLNEK
jgi:RNA polymerase sigma-70 factor (ECF subfamily)